MDSEFINNQDAYKYIICFRKAKKLYKNCIEKDLKKYKLTQIEIEIIIYLSRNIEQNTAKDITEYLGLSKGMISRTIDQLISKKILEIEKDKSDKRISRLRITKDSAPLINDLEKSRTKFLDGITSGIEKSNLDVFANVLEEMIDNLEVLEKDM
ncbi:MAG: MarR family winged helix-turn-helix transcriptional regulator [Sarcina sp.]